MKKKTKKKETNKFLEIVNNPNILIIALLIITVWLVISLGIVKNENKFYTGELSTNDLAVSDIHYYSSPNATFFYANQAVYAGEEKQISKILIGYYVKVGDELKQIDVTEKEFEKPINLSDAVITYSKFNVAGLKNGFGIYLSKEIKKNMTNLYLVVRAQTTKSDNYDINYEEPIQLYRVNK